MGWYQRRVHGAELWSVEVTSVDTPDQVTWKSAAKRVKLPWLSGDIYHGMCFRRSQALLAGRIRYGTVGTVGRIDEVGRCCAPGGPWPRTNSLYNFKKEKSQ